MINRQKLALVAATVALLFATFSIPGGAAPAGEGPGRRALGIAVRCRWAARRLCADERGRAQVVERLRVAVLGAGTVGTEVVRLLRSEAGDLAARVGAPLDLVGIAVRNRHADRDPVVPTDLLTEDARALVDRADVVVEVMGGIEPARELILRAIRHGAAVVTANKALLAEDGPTLYAAADAAGVDLYFEAAVAGGIPVVRGPDGRLTGVDTKHAELDRRRADVEREYRHAACHCQLRMSGKSTPCSLTYRRWRSMSLQ